MSTILGSEFMKIHKDVQFYKVLTKNFIHDNYHYKLDELNICNNFNAERRIGLSFIDKWNLDQMLFYKPDMTYIAEVEIPTDAIVVISDLKLNNYDHAKYKTNRMILKNPKPIDEFETFKDFLIKDSRALKFLKFNNATPELIEIVFKHNPNKIKTINKQLQTLETIRYVININPKLFKYVRIDLQTFEIIKLAIKNDVKEFNNINHDQIEKLSSDELNELYNIILMKDLYCLRTLKQSSQTYELCKRIVEIRGIELKYVRNNLHSEELYKLAIQNDVQSYRYTISHLQTLELSNLAVKTDGLLLKYVNSMYFDQVMTIAVKQNGLAIQYICNELLTSRICEIAVKQNGLAIQYICDKLLTFKICEIAVKSNNDAMKFIKKKYQNEFYNNGCWLFGLKAKYINSNDLEEF